MIVTPPSWILVINASPGCGILWSDDTLSKQNKSLASSYDNPQCIFIDLVLYIGYLTAISRKL